MTISKCPNCGGSNQYARAQVPANGAFGPHLLPKLRPGRFYIVICKDCGLTRFFASRVDTQSLSNKWKRVADVVPMDPLGMSR
jgi:predicted nucleic-acid-binding Zn-ribbon protein